MIKMIVSMVKSSGGSVPEGKKSVAIEVTLQPGEAAFLGAGIIHAHLSGLCLEVMVASDNVLRAGAELVVAEDRAVGLSAELAELGGDLRMHTDLNNDVVGLVMLRAARSGGSNRWSY